MSQCPPGCSSSTAITVPLHCLQNMPPSISASSGTLPSSFPMTGTDTKCFVSTYGPSSLLVEMTQLKGWLGLQNIGRPPPHVGLKKA